MSPKAKAITITPDLVEKWKSQVEAIRKRMQRDNEELGRLQKKLELVGLLFEEDESGGELTATTTPMDVKSMRPSQVILFFAKVAGGPLTKSELRERVHASGYPDEKWGHQFSYFYTLVKRLKRTGKLIEEGGRIRAA